MTISICKTMRANLVSVMLTYFIFLSVFFSCKDTHREGLAAFDNLKKYISYHRDSAEYYYEKDWDEIEQGYLERKAEADKYFEGAGEDMKKEYEKLDSEWAAYKSDYENHKAMQASIDFRKAFVPAGINSDFSNVTADQLLSVYQYFVDYTDQHKDEFTREQWDEIKIMWERLDTRKNELEKDLTAGDNTKIAGLKIRFVAIKAVNRSEAKAEENEEAKESQ